MFFVDNFVLVQNMVFAKFKPGNWRFVVYFVFVPSRFLYESRYLQVWLKAKCA